MVLIELSNDITPLLEMIFRRSLTTGQVPEDWKEVNVVLIFKKADRHKPSNYRPVSLTCMSSQIMEHVSVSNLLKHNRYSKPLTSSPAWLPSKLLLRISTSSPYPGPITSCTAPTDMLIMDFK